jgi:hypothetical protein
MDYDKLGNLLDEISNHANENAGGSYGVGHLSSFKTSILSFSNSFSILSTICLLPDV